MASFKMDRMHARTSQLTTEMGSAHTSQLAIAHRTSAIYSRTLQLMLWKQPAFQGGHVTF